MMVGIVDHAELARGHAMNLVLRVHSKLCRAGPLQCGWVIFWCVANLECDVCGLQLACEIVEIANREVLLVGCLRVVAVRHISYIINYVLLDHKPRTTTKAHALTLADGVKP